MLDQTYNKRIIYLHLLALQTAIKSYFYMIFSTVYQYVMRHNFYVIFEFKIPSNRLYVRFTSTANP